MCVELPIHRLIPSRWVSSIIVFGSKRPSGHTFVCPLYREEMAVARRPETWNKGKTARFTGTNEGSGGVFDMSRARAPIIIWVMQKAITIRWLSTAALGRPVVPLVNKRTTGSSSSMSTVGRSTFPSPTERAANSLSISMVGTDTSGPSRSARLLSKTSSLGSVIRERALPQDPSTTRSWPPYGPRGRHRPRTLGSIRGSWRRKWPRGHPFGFHEHFGAHERGWLPPARALHMSTGARHR